jgi:hypothetical protein
VNILVRVVTLRAVFVSHPAYLHAVAGILCFCRKILNVHAIAYFTIYVEFTIVIWKPSHTYPCVVGTIFAVIITFAVIVAEIPSPSDTEIDFQVPYTGSILREDVWAVCVRNSLPTDRLDGYSSDIATVWKLVVIPNL